MKISGEGVHQGPVCVLDECPARGKGVLCYGEEGDLSYWKCKHFKNYLMRHEDVRVWDIPDNSELSRQIRHSENYCPSGLERFLNSRLGQNYMGGREYEP